MGSQFDVVENSANIVDAFLAGVFLTIMLGKKKKLPVWGNLGIGFVLCIANCLLQTIFLDSPANICIYIGLGFVYALICLNGKLSQKVLTIAIWNVLFMFCEIGYATLYRMFNQNSSQDIWQMSQEQKIHYLIGIKLLVLLLSAIVVIVLKKVQLNSSMLIMNVVVFVISIVIGFILDLMLDYNYLDKSGKAAIGIAMLGIVTINIFVYIATFQISKNQKLLMENQLLRMSQEEQKESMERMLQLQEKNKILRHNLRHYFTLFQELLASGKTEDARRYVEEVLNTKLKAEGVYMTGDEILDAVLNHCDSVCRQKNIPFHVEVSAHLPEGQMEFAIALLNLLENAIEAEEQEEEKLIELQIYEKVGLLLVTVRNRISHSVMEENPELRTKKADASIHGLGRKSVKKLIRDMEGSFYEEEKNGFFISNIVV